MKLRQHEIKEIKNEVKILKELQSDYILRYYEDYEEKEYYLIITEKCVSGTKMINVIGFF